MTENLDGRQEQLDVVPVDATEEDKDGGSPKQVNVAEMNEPIMTPT